MHQLVDNARASGNPNLLAYRYGYLTHYVTDTVGTPLCESSGTGPLAFVLAAPPSKILLTPMYGIRWHVSDPPPAPPSTEEQPLDTLTLVPDLTGTGWTRYLCSAE